MLPGRRTTGISGCVRAQLLDQPESVVPRHDDVDDRQVVRPRPKPFERLLRAAGGSSVRDRVIPPTAPSVRAGRVRRPRSVTEVNVVTVSTEAATVEQEYCHRLARPIRWERLGCATHTCAFDTHRLRMCDSAHIIWALASISRALRGRRRGHESGPAGRRVSSNLRTFPKAAIGRPLLLVVDDGRRCCGSSSASPAKIGLRSRGLRIGTEAMRRADAPASGPRDGRPPDARRQRAWICCARFESAGAELRSHPDDRLAPPSTAPSKRIKLGAREY